MNKRRIILYKRILCLLITSVMLLMTSCTADNDQYGAIVSERLESNETEKHYDSLSSLFKCTDGRRTESVDYESAVSAYDELLDDIFRLAEEKDFSCYPRFAVAYIDGDETPELLVAYGSYHEEGVSVYRYDEASDCAVNIGTFGSFGSFEYFEGESIVVSQYGNMGSYSYYASRINDDNTVSLVDLWCVDGTGITTDEILYYHGYDLRDDEPEVDGTRECFEKYGLNEFYIYGDVSEDNMVTESEYLKSRFDWLGVSEEKSVTISYEMLYDL